MAQHLSHFFSKLELPLSNVRWSWGASAGSTVLLRTWTHDLDREGGVRRVRVLRGADDVEGSASPGLSERIRQLESIWGGGMAAYTVMVTAVDPNARAKVIKDFRNDVIFPISRLEALPDGSLAAVLEDAPVPVGKVPVHAQQHRTAGGDGAFPGGKGAAAGVRRDATANGATSASEAVHREPTISEPLTSLIESEIEKASDSEKDGFEDRVARFAQVEVRPQQAQFRLAVFRAHRGRCVVSGCDVPEALEAAHRTGRDWRAGHNTAADGLLLRRDLHTLYDRGLLAIDEDGCVKLDERVRAHYGQWHKQPMAGT